MRTKSSYVLLPFLLFAATFAMAAEERDEASRLSGAIRNEQILIDRLEQNRRYAAAAYLANKAMLETTLEALAANKAKDENYRFKRQELDNAGKLLAMQDEALKRLEYYQDKEASIDERIDASLMRIERLRARLRVLPEPGKR